MSYIGALNSKQKQNIDVIIDVMERSGIRNKYAQAAVLSVISKESRFYPQAEISYANTDNSRIKDIFGWRVGGFDDAGLSALKADPVAFFNQVYGGRHDNAQNEGYKFRGRGFNQITFKGNYRMVGDRIGKDLVKNPDLLGKPKIAAEASVSYFTENFRKSYSSSHKQHYNSNDINGFKSLNDAVLAFYHANAGFQKPMFTVSQSTSTGGLRKALSRSPEFLKYVEDYQKKKHLNVVVGLVVLALILAAGFLAIRKTIKDG